MAMRMSIKRNPHLREAMTQLMELNPADMTAMTGAVDFRFRGNMAKLFSSEGASAGPKWAELSEPYRARKKRLRPGRKILVFDGHLRRSLTTTGGDHVARSSLRPARITVGTSDEIARFHATGTRTMPERDPIRHTPEQVKDYYAAIEDYLVEQKWARILRVLQAGTRAAAPGN